MLGKVCPNDVTAGSDLGSKKGRRSPDVDLLSQEALHRKNLYMSGMEKVEGAVDVHDTGAGRRGHAVGELHDAPARRHEAADRGVRGAAAAVSVLELVQHHPLLPAAELLCELPPLLQATSITS